MPSSRSKTAINAVHEEDQRPLLEASLGVADAFDNGSLRCASCDRPLKEAGIGAARAEGDSVVFACQYLDCIRAVSGGIREDED